MNTMFVLHTVLNRHCKLEQSRGGDNTMENPKVKTKVHDPANLIPEIDIRWFAKLTENFGQTKVVPRQCYFLTPRGPPWVTKMAQSGC